ncbi:hypothetical protein [Kiritimatiella glycovorans]|uniref:Glycosyl hydrolase-like 10 domain-containing protein n=1 Tax=Kiritimatiella glycovorans TaxID=1307763 RepID=A0A0G3EE08_9BACT|nr:hypothetical protein [Kiritimatiella glycovorans]AKJ63652.1 hypothetical protein L21SP4_00372 [Kiritimatiella glycovorans]
MKRDRVLKIVVAGVVLSAGLAAAPAGAQTGPDRRSAGSLPDMLVNDDGTALTFEIFRNAKHRAAKTHWISLTPNYYYGDVDPRWIPVEPYESFDQYAAVRWEGLQAVAPDVSLGIALCVNLSVPWPYGYESGVFPEHPVWGKDPLTPYVAWCREHNIEPYFSIRMNDQHHSVHANPMYHVGRFFWDQPELFIDPPSREEWEELYLPWINRGTNQPSQLPESYRKGGPDYHDLRVNYAFEQVRDFYVGLAEDLAENHPDASGIELDFMRSLKFFPEGEEEPEKLTRVVRRIRESLDRVEDRSGNRIRLVARIPTYHDGYAAGMRVRQWLDEDLLDGIVLGHGTFFSDNAMEEWAAYAKSRDTKVYGPIERMYFKTRIREATPEKVRGVASTLYGKGAEGLYFFNWFAPEEHYLLPELADRQALRKKNKTYFADTARVARDKKELGSRLIRTPLVHRAGEVPSLYRFVLSVNSDFKAADEIRLSVHTENIHREFIRITVNDAEVTDDMRLIYGAGRLTYRLPDTVARKVVENGDNRIDVRLSANPFDEDLIIEGVTCDFLY